MIRKIVLNLLILIVFLAPAASWAKSAVTAYRMADKDGFTRFVLDVQDFKNHKAFTLENPSRLVIDVKESAWKVQKGAMPKVTNDLIRKIRTGRPKPETLRIVLDLRRNVKIKQSFVLEPNDTQNTSRLVVDFVDSGAVKPAKIKTAKAQSSLPASMQKSKAKPSKKPASMQKDKPVMKMPVKSKTPKPQRLQRPPQTAKTLPVPPSMKGKPIIRKVDKPKRKPKAKRPKQWAEIPVIVIDAGHGGIDPGAIGRSGAREKKITFAYAVELKNKLEKTGKYKVVLTRKGDYYVNLRERVRIAKEAKGDLFISLHADSHPNRKTRGLSVYTLSEKASDREAAALAKRANREEVVRGVDLKDDDSEVQELLIDMVQRDTKNTSASFAEILVKALGKEAKLLRNTHRFAGFVVLTSADVPSVLLELGYLSNKHEEKLLRTSAYKRKLTDAMVTAISRYFKG